MSNTKPAAALALLLARDGVARRVLSDAIDERAGVLEALLETAPEQVEYRAELMTVWGLQAIMFQLGERT